VKNRDQEEPIVDDEGNPIVRMPNQLTKSADVIVGTIETLGIGVTLHRASLVVILEPQFLESFAAQAKKSVHRLGQRYAHKSWVLHTDTLQSERLIANRGEFRKMFAEAVAVADSGDAGTISDENENKI
jgi:hypothetical protein